jgi:hypothetical protein
LCDQKTSKNEEAKARYRAVENTTTMGCNARKTNMCPSSGETTVFMHPAYQTVIHTE